MKRSVKHALRVYTLYTPGEVDIKQKTVRACAVLRARQLNGTASVACSPNVDDDKKRPNNKIAQARPAAKPRPVLC